VNLGARSIVAAGHERSADEFAALLKKSIHCRDGVTQHAMKLVYMMKAKSHTKHCVGHNSADCTNFGSVTYRLIYRIENDQMSFITLGHRSEVYDPRRPSYCLLMLNS
jgi:hypothetical protein